MPILLLILAIVTVTVLLGLLVRHVPASCQVCARHCRFWRQLTSEEQEAVTKHYRQVEEREPPFADFFFCDHCHCIADDFYGEKRSREYDGIQHFDPLSGQLLEVRCVRVNCKRCGQPMMVRVGEDLETPCPRCECLQAWRPVTGTAFLAFTPVDGESTSQKPAPQRPGIDM